MNYTIRTYQEPDTRPLMALFYETVHTINLRDYTPEQVNAWAPTPPEAMDYDAWLVRLGGKYTLVAEGEDGTLLGFTNLEPIEGEEGAGHIDQFFVHNAYQGIGVGRALLTALEQEAQRRGMTRLYTEASITAQPFFARYGFQTIVQQTVVRFDVELTNYRMEKVLLIAK